MFRNIDDKLEILASILFSVTTAIFIITCLLIIAYDLLVGILLIVVGPCLSLPAALFFHGVAEIINKVTKIEVNTRKDKSGYKASELDPVENF